MAHQQQEDVMDVASVLNDINAAKRAYDRVRPKMDAVTDYSPMNVDVVSATSVVLGVADGVLAYRERLATLPEFDMSQVDNLIDYATAAWYVFITNLSSPEPGNLPALMEEVTALRGKLLMWAGPLVQNGNFTEAAIAKIKEGSGNKDAPSDLVALVGLYRSHWAEVENLCAVTEADLDRGAQIGPYVFALVSQKEQRATPTSEDALRVRRAWTLVDTAYDQCRRGLNYLLWGDPAVDVVAPSLRRNIGPRSTSRASATNAQPSQPQPQVQPPAPSAAGGAPVGGNQSPFANPAS